MSTSRLPWFHRWHMCLWLLLLGAGCESVDELLEWPPPVSFRPYLIRHPLDLAQLLGQEARLISTRDTLDIRIHYDAATGLNLLTRAPAGDTLQQVWVSRYRRLYYFTWPINDTCYWVHAVRIRQGRVQGLTDTYFQMRQLERAVRAGRLPTLLGQQTDTAHVLRLPFNQKALRKFYGALLDNLPVYKLAPRRLPAGAVVSPAAVRPVPATQQLLRSLHPNPATDFVTLRLCATSACEVAVFTATGQLAFTAATPDTVCTVPVSQLPTGRYVVRVRESGTGRTSSRQLLVEK